MGEENSKKIKRIIWSDEETERMLLIVRDNNIVSLLDGKRYRNVDIYTQIVNKLLTDGYTRTADQVRIKLKSLRKAYIEAKKNNLTSGAERRECEFYELLDEIYGTRPLLISDNDGIQSGSGPPFSQNTVFEESEESSLSSPRCETAQAPRPKRLRKNLEELRQVEEHLLKQNQDFWSREFEKQRQHEKEMNEKFCSDIRSVFQEFSSVLKDISSAANTHKSTPLTIVRNSGESSSSVSTASPIKLVQITRSSTPLKSFLSSDRPASLQLPHLSRAFQTPSVVRNESIPSPETTQLSPTEENSSSGSLKEFFRNFE